MSRLQFSTLSVEVEDEWLPYEGREQYTVVLKFGDSEVSRWVVQDPDSRWMRGYGHGDEDRVQAAEEFVAAKLAEALTPKPAVL